MRLAEMAPSDGPDRPYWEALADGRLVLPRCEGCGSWQWPAVDRCGACGSEDIAWVERPMQGTIFSWTRTWHRFELTESLDLPFLSIVASVDDCGIRLLGRLEDGIDADPEISARVTGRAGTTRVLDRDIPTIIWARVP